MAHSYGGVVTVELAQQFLRDFKQRVVAVMFTDSVHHLSKGKGGRDISAIVKSIYKVFIIQLDIFNFEMHHTQALINAQPSLPVRPRPILTPPN